MGRRVRLRGASVIYAGIGIVSDVVIGRTLEVGLRRDGVSGQGGFSPGRWHGPHVYSLGIMGLPSWVKVGIG